MESTIVNIYESHPVGDNHGPGSTGSITPVSHYRDPIVVAILAKNKAYSLPIYLDCLLRQTYPKSLLHLYIRTNDNTDTTVPILKAFLEDHGSKYASIFYDDSSISESLKDYKNHEWNAHRFKILGKIRQDSVTYASQKGAHYMVIDCDNFIVPQTFQTLLENAHNGVIAPMLITDTNYSNFHYDIDKNGYYKDHAMYKPVLSRTVKGLIEVPVVHCTYMIHNRYLKDVVYDDESYRYEYVIFSNGLRTRRVPQILDNRTFYGVVEFSEGDACQHRFNTLWKPYHKQFSIDLQ